MNKTKLSIGFKIIAYISIVIASCVILAMMIIVLLKFSSEIHVGAIIPILAWISLLVAGIGALNSIRTGFYLYLSSCIIWLVKNIPHAIIKAAIFEQMPQSLSNILAVILAIIRFPFWISLLGAIISYYEFKKLKRLPPNKNGN